MAGAIAAAAGTVAAGGAIDTLFTALFGFYHIPGGNACNSQNHSNDHKINGFIYELENNEPKGIVIVVHGAGGGHDSYMHEICYFAKLGYKVFAYDNTGTMLSEGDKLKGFEQSLLDLRECILDIQSSLEYAGLKIILYGHSWGAFTVSSVSNYDDVKVDGIVSLSAFNHPLIELTRMLTEQIGKFFYQYLYNKFYFAKGILDNKSNAEDYELVYTKC